jgi:hypothetical protein
MSAASINVGEQLYEYKVKFTSVTEFGVSMDALMSGKTAPPPEGARFDVAFEGPSSGPKLKGTVVGVDHLHVRADGRFQLHIHAAISTVEGAKISLFADGVALLREHSPIADLRENVTLTTSAKAYSWVNQLQVWATGTVDLEKQEVDIKGYVA